MEWLSPGYPVKTDIWRRSGRGQTEDATWGSPSCKTSSSGRTGRTWWGEFSWVLSPGPARWYTSCWIWKVTGMTSGNTSSQVRSRQGEERDWRWPPGLGLAHTYSGQPGQLVWTAARLERKTSTGLLLSQSEPGETLGKGGRGFKDKQAKISPVYSQEVLIIQYFISWHLDKEVKEDNFLLKEPRIVLQSFRTQEW